MDKGDISLAATMGVGTVQGFTTFVGTVSTADMLDPESYKRGLGLSLGWTFLISASVGAFSKSYSPLWAWLLVSGAMLSAYEYHRDKAFGVD